MSRGSQYGHPNENNSDDNDIHITNHLHLHSVTFILKNEIKKYSSHHRIAKMLLLFLLKKVKEAFFSSFIHQAKLVFLIGIVFTRFITLKLLQNLCWLFVSFFICFFIVLLILLTNYLLLLSSSFFLRACSFFYMKARMIIINGDDMIAVALSAFLVLKNSCLNLFYCVFSFCRSNKCFFSCLRVR